MRPVHPTATIAAMTDRQRQLAFVRFMEIEAELEALAEGRVVDGDPATAEVELLQEQDAIEIRVRRRLFRAAGPVQLVASLLRRTACYSGPWAAHERQQDGS